VYTWQKFLETGDETWPLHFPMAKAVLKAMDAVQEFTKQDGQPSVDGFLITGASKRGWTTWLVGASGDPRVKAIAPMVIDTLNLPAQMPHQLKAYGKPSEQIEAYTEAGIMQKMDTKEGKRLVQLEDPYSYLDRLTLPKLIVLGTNDRYWSQDSLNLYWDALKGPKWVLYNPNVGHGLDALDAQLRVLSTVGAFANTVAEQAAWPQMKWGYKANKAGADLTVTSTPQPKSGKIYFTSADTQDFRDSKWTSKPMEAGKNGLTGHLDAPAKGYSAMYGELTYEVNGKTFVLCTQIHIQPAADVALAPGKRAAQQVALGR
ncbi:MAG TPA: PhoPQ-activated protein PqaA family protein, partial [Chthonomonadaceae bacterium]|nr:PhoPQ-activated protein PqaA family protein [Chthonomonadaceae bacterium]